MYSGSTLYWIPDNERTSQKIEGKKSALKHFLRLHFAWLVCSLSVLHFIVKLIKWTNVKFSRFPIVSQYYNTLSWELAEQQFFLIVFLTLSVNHPDLNVGISFFIFFKSSAGTFCGGITDHMSTVVTFTGPKSRSVPRNGIPASVDAFNLLDGPANLVVVSFVSVDLTKGKFIPSSISPCVHQQRDNWKCNFYSEIINISISCAWICT